MTWKDTPFLFREQEKQEFEDLKRAFTLAPILTHFDAASLTTFKIYASNYALGACISQCIEGWFPQIVFESKKLISAKLNYEIHNKELIAIFWAFQKCLLYLLSLTEPFEILPDQDLLKHFMTKKILSQRQAHWGMILSEYNFTITHHHGVHTIIADALSRCKEVYP